LSRINQLYTRQEEDAADIDKNHAKADFLKQAKQDEPVDVADLKGLLTRFVSQFKDQRGGKANWKDEAGKGFTEAEQFLGYISGLEKDYRR